MLELLKKLGLPSAVAAVVATVITVTPFLFKIDERYAKAEELKEEIQKLEVKVNALNTEIGKLAGVTEVLVVIVGQGVNSRVEASSPARPSAPVAAPRPPSAPSEVQAPPPPPIAVVTPSTPSTVPPLKIESVEVPAPPEPGATWRDKQTTLDQAQRALESSRRNIERIEKY